MDLRHSDGALNPDKPDKPALSRERTASTTATTAGAAYGWQISLDQHETHQTWTWNAYGPRGSRRGTTHSEDSAKAKAQAAVRELTQPSLRVLGC